MEKTAIAPLSETRAEAKKTEYFSRLARKFYSAFVLHQTQGKLWDRTDEGKRSWGNVSEHCLVEVARAGVLSDLLKFSPEAKENFMYAAALHDLSKRREKELPVSEGGISWEEYETEVSQWSEGRIVMSGFSQEIADLSEAVGHGSLPKIEKMLEHPENLSESDITYLAMHYVDAYTRGSEWVTPYDGVTSELDLRAKKNKDNKTLARLQEDGKKVFNGRNYNDVMVDAVHKIEILFSRLIRERKNLAIEPARIPEFIDEQIGFQIEGIH